MPDDTPDPAQFAPGSFGCHEALHMASVLMEAVAERLCEHEAIKMQPDWLAKADEARQALFDLYQMIGAAHLTHPADDAAGGV